MSLVTKYTAFDANVILEKALKATKSRILKAQLRDLFAEAEHIADLCDKEAMLSSILDKRELDDAQIKELLNILSQVKNHALSEALLDYAHLYKAVLEDETKTWTSYYKKYAELDSFDTIHELTYESYQAD